MLQKFSTKTFNSGQPVFRSVGGDVHQQRLLPPARRLAPVQVQIGIPAIRGSRFVRGTGRMRRQRLLRRVFIREFNIEIFAIKC